MPLLVDQNRLKLMKEYALSELSSGDNVNPEVDSLAMNAASDYVNASLVPSTPPTFIPKYSNDRGCYPKVYVAAQAPKSCSVGLFWQAIWDSNVSLIVMLTR